MRSLIALLLVGLLVGCALKESHETELGSYSSDLGGFNYDNVHSLSTSLYDGNKGKLSVDYLQAQRQPNQLLKVNLMLRNRTDHRLVIEARTLFLGEGGAPAGDTSAWQRLFLEPKGVAEYQESSLKMAEIKHFRVEVRESD